MKKGLKMLNLNIRYKKLLIAGIIFLFSTASVSAYVKKCCHMEKTAVDHSCCVGKASFSYKQASKCECKISIPRDLVSENKSNVTDNLLKYPVSFARDTYVINIPSENNDILRRNKSLFKSCSVPIFLKDCSFLI